MTTDTQTTEVETISFFAYGTLRKGQHLHGWIKDEVIEAVGIGTMRFAKLFFSPYHRSYPYLKFTGHFSDQAIGEVYELPVNDTVISMLQMEQNAGYRLAEAEVEVNGEPRQVLVCAWDGAVGGSVTDNDWIAEATKEPWE